MAFTPRPGQVDYTNIRYAPVINCVVTYQGKILLLKRSEQLNFYPGYWNGASGFLDDHSSLEDKVSEELHEELHITAQQVASVTLGRIFHQEDETIGKTWIVHPVLVHVNTDALATDWEAEECRWVTLQEAKRMKLMPGFLNVLTALFDLADTPV